jgi:hypothetical protein
MNAPSLRSPSRSCSARHRLPREPSWPAPRSPAIEWSGASNAARRTSWSVPVAVFCSGRAGQPGSPAHSPRRARPPPSRPAQAIARAQIPPARSRQPSSQKDPVTVGSRSPRQCAACRPRPDVGSRSPGRWSRRSHPTATRRPKATLRVRRDGRMVFRRAGVECCDVALAGTTLAWRSGGAVDVFGLATRRLRFRAAPPAGASIAACDVQADGKLAMLVGRQPDGHATLAWRSAADRPYIRSSSPLSYRVTSPGCPYLAIGSCSKPRRTPPRPTMSPARLSWYPTSPDGHACSHDSPVGSNRSAASTPPRARSPGPRAASPAHGSTARHPARCAWSERPAPSPSGAPAPPAEPRPRPRQLGIHRHAMTPNESNIASARPMAEQRSDNCVSIPDRSATRERSPEVRRRGHADLRKNRRDLIFARARQTVGERCGVRKLDDRVPSATVARQSARVLGLLGWNSHGTERAQRVANVRLPSSAKTA